MRAVYAEVLRRARRGTTAAMWWLEGRRGWTASRAAPDLIFNPATPAHQNHANTHKHVSLPRNLSSFRSNLRSLTWFLVPIVSPSGPVRDPRSHPHRPPLRPFRHANALYHRKGSDTLRTSLRSTVACPQRMPDTSDASVAAVATVCCQYTPLSSLCTSHHHHASRAIGRVHASTLSSTP